MRIPRWAFGMRWWLGLMFACPLRQIMEHLWGSAHIGDEHTCEVHISTLRRKIERDPSCPERLVTIRGVGHSLCPA